MMGSPPRPDDAGDIEPPSARPNRWQLPRRRRPGRKAGEFFHAHSIATDPKGNILVGESQGYRVQKFIYKGLSTGGAR